MLRSKINFFIVAFFVGVVLATPAHASSFPNDSKSISGTGSTGTSFTIGTVPSGHTWTILEVCLMPSTAGAFYISSDGITWLYQYGATGQFPCVHPYQSRSAGKTIVMNKPSGVDVFYSVVYVDYDLATVASDVTVDTTALETAIGDLNDAVDASSLVLQDEIHYLSGLVFYALVVYIAYRIIAWIFSIFKDWALTW